MESTINNKHCIFQQAYMKVSREQHLVVSESILRRGPIVENGAMPARKGAHTAAPRVERESGQHSRVRHRARRRRERLRTRRSNPREEFSFLPNGPRRPPNRITRRRAAEGRESTSPSGVSGAVRTILENPNELSEKNAPSRVVLITASGLLGEQPLAK